MGILDKLKHGENREISDDASKVRAELGARAALPEDTFYVNGEVDGGLHSRKALQEEFEEYTAEQDRNKES